MARQRKRFICATHPSISLIKSSKLSYLYTRPSSRSRSESSSTKSARLFRLCLSIQYDNYKNVYRIS